MRNKIYRNNLVWVTRLMIFFILLGSGSGCHRKELPSTKLRKEMRAANQKSIKAGKKLRKQNKKKIGKRKK